MMKHKIKFLPYNKEITVEDGENLIRAAMETGVHINASCGGEGVCGKCRVIIEDGDVGGGITEKLSKKICKKATGKPACLMFRTILLCASPLSQILMPVSLTCKKPRGGQPGSGK